MILSDFLQKHVHVIPTGCMTSVNAIYNEYVKECDDPVPNDDKFKTAVRRHTRSVSQGNMISGCAVKNLYFMPNQISNFFDLPEFMRDALVIDPNESVTLKDLFAVYHMLGGVTSKKTFMNRIVKAIQGRWKVRTIKGVRTIEGLTIRSDNQ